MYNFKVQTLSMELFLAIRDSKFTDAMIILKELEEVLKTYERSC